MLFSRSRKFITDIVFFCILKLFNLVNFEKEENGIKGLFTSDSSEMTHKFV